MAVSMLCEGNRVRSIERMTSIHRDAIMRLGVRVGEGCRKLLDESMRGLACSSIQADEMRGFIGAKKKTVAKNKLDPGFGDVWVWSAIDADTKLAPSVVVGDRDLPRAMRLMDDLAESRRYSPPECMHIERRVEAGNPDMKKVSTSYIEKQNHTARMHCRRLSRLTNAFSKKRRNFEAAISLHYAYCNLCERHQTIRCAPAMEAGVMDSQMSVAELVERTDSN